MPYSAAEVERFVYCPLSWKLAQGGHEGSLERLSAGNEAHAAVGKRIAWWREMLGEHQEALRVALYLALTAASAATLALEVVVIDTEGIFHWILILMSLTWLLVALGFLLRSIWKENEARAYSRKEGFVEGELAYSDLDRPAETLHSDKYDVSGKPDYVVRQGEHYIPVEVKSGRTPVEPHDSHVMQVGVYCLLIEERYGNRPPMGVVQYPDKSFRIPFTDAFRDRIFQTILRMRLAEMTGEIHRNHDRPGKCLGCSRREGCPERLA